MTGYRDEHNKQQENQQYDGKRDQPLQQEPIRTITMPTGGIVLLMGPSGSGKTTWLEQLVENGTLLSSETVSSDRFRQLVGDTDHIDWRQHPREEGDVLYQQYRLISDRAFRVMEETIAARARLNLLTWVDATHLHPEDRAVYINLARRNHVHIVVAALDVPEKVLLERDRTRLHARGRQRIKQHIGVFRENMYKLKSEGFDAVHLLKPRDLELVRLERTANPLLQPLGNGVDVIGDIHGCYEEMMQLIHKLGYVADEQGIYRHPDGRMLVSVGDIMSRGPRSLETMQFWQRQLAAQQALMVDSNHGWKVTRYLEGRQVQMNHGDEQFVAELEQYGAVHGQEALDTLKEQFRTMLLAAPSHLVFTHNGVRRLIVTHAGIRDHYIGKQSKGISDYCRYGETDGQDDSGKPQRTDWFANHESGEWIVWGHDPRLRPTIVNRTVNIDQGVVFGGQLTAYRFPEQSFVAVDALHDYAQDADSPLERQRKRRFAAPNLTPLINGYSVMTDSYGEIGVRSEFVKAAVDTVSHYTVPLEELMYVPPTMTPSAVSALDDYLEHPAEALAYYRSRNVSRIVAQKKHMGSRAIVLLFRDSQAAISYIGRPLSGRIYTRTGRAFFPSSLEQQVLDKLRTDLEYANYFEQYGTDFVLLDTEIVPWNLKARELISSQYAHVAEAALHDRRTILDTLHTAQQQGREVADWIGEWRERLDNAQRFAEAFQAYCWDTDGLDGIQIAPFHILAHSTGSLMDREHTWHMQHAEQLAQSCSMILATEYQVVELDDEHAEQQLVQWWSDMTEQGHEGVVIKPECMTTYDGDRLVQPAIKVRGRKYLHIIYGMDYLQPDNLKRLKQRKTRKKERHALMEFALSLESVARFVRQEPLERMHECVLAALSLEADAVDPRL